MSETVRDRRAERFTATRAEILAAAWEVAREKGLAALTLRDVAERVGMRAPSLYSYFGSKNDLYDAMFAQGYRELGARFEELAPGDLRRSAHEFVAFCVEDSARYQLLFQRTVPGFVPSEASYAVAVEHLEAAREELAAAGVTDPRHLDLWTALLTGLTDQQISNDPGGDRWARLVDEAVDMFLTHVGGER